MGPESATRVCPGKVASLWWEYGVEPTSAKRTPKTSNALIRDKMPQFFLDAYSMLMLFVQFDSNSINLCPTCALWQQSIVKCDYFLKMFEFLQILLILGMYSWYQTKQCIKILYHLFTNTLITTILPSWQTILTSHTEWLSAIACTVDRIVSSVRREHLIL